MSNLLTAVPAQPPPPPRTTAKRLVPVADLFMAALLSRPATGSLATTWVTRATLLLATACLVGMTTLIAVLVANAGQWPVLVSVLGTIACVAFGAGSISVLIVGLDQRRSRQP
jgi:hypothetical protein